MPKINSRQKGAKGEREFAAWLNATFPALNARRGCQFQGSKDSPDVAGGIPGTHAEVKRVEALNVGKAMLQAIRDAGGNLPYVAHRRNKGEWLLTLRAADVRLFALLVSQLIDCEDAAHEPKAA